LNTGPASVRAVVGERWAAGGGAFGVYVHIPFCRRRCDYCAFATWSDRYEMWPRYVDACIADAHRLARFARGPATSVFFGGGTPSLLPADALVGILEALRRSVGLALGAEVTVECNPETVSAAKLAAYRAGGVTRLSFGAQSMVPHVLDALGRQHDPASVVSAARLAAEAGFAGSYSVDLIFGAVGETMADWRASLEGVLSLDPAPSHVSAYALTVEPGTPLAGEPARHPDDDDQADKYFLADNVLTGAGLGWYEISNWARPGRRCAHNLVYWAQGEYLGLGCAAHSHLVFPDGSARRWWNVRTPERYCRLVQQDAGVEALGETLSPRQRAAEALVLVLRTSAGVPTDVVPAELYECGLVAPGPGRQGARRAVLTVRGRLLANEVAVRLHTVREVGRETGPPPGPVLFAREEAEVW
jgi:putative oxygen-independent coproporphyrinogen III oxidase